MPFVDPEEFSGGLWPGGYRAAGARYPRKHSPWNSACGATGRTQMAPVLGSVRYAPGSRARTPHEILVRNNGQEVTRVAEILTPADLIGHHGKPPYQPRKPLDPKSQMGCGTDPGGLDWRSLGLVELMGGRSGNRGRRQIGSPISEFYRKGVNSPAHCGQKLNFTLISLKVEVFSAAKCPLHRAGQLRNQGFPWRGVFQTRYRCGQESRSGRLSAKVR